MGNVIVPIDYLLLQALEQRGRGKSCPPILPLASALQHLLYAGEACLQGFEPELEISNLQLGIYCIGYK